MRTSSPCRPSGRSAASTSKNASDASRIVSPATRVSSAVGGLADEDDVDVADVVQFARTAFAHRDHGEPRPLALSRRSAVIATFERSGQRGVGQIGQMRADRRERQHRLVLHRGATSSAASTISRLRYSVRSAGSLASGGRFGDAVERTRDAARRPTAATPRRRADATPAGWRPGGRPAPATSPTTRTAGPAATGPCSRHRFSSSPAIAERVGQPHHRAQRGVGVGRARQRPQQLHVLVGGPAQPGQICGRGGRLDQPQPAGLGSLRSLRRWFGHAYDSQARAGVIRATSRSSARTG